MRTVTVAIVQLISSQPPDPRFESHSGRSTQKKEEARSKARLRQKEQAHRNVVLIPRVGLGGGQGKKTEEARSRSERPKWHKKDEVEVAATRPIGAPATPKAAGGKRRRFLDEAAPAVPAPAVPAAAA